MCRKSIHIISIKNELYFPNLMSYCAYMNINIIQNSRHTTGIGMNREPPRWLHASTSSCKFHHALYCTIKLPPTTTSIKTTENIYPVIILRKNPAIKIPKISKQIQKFTLSYFISVRRHHRTTQRKGSR